MGNVASLDHLKTSGLTTEQANDVQKLRQVILAPAPAGNFPTLRDKIRAEKAWRQDRYNAYARLYALAHVVALEAGYAHQPEPMIVSGYEHQPVVGGVCGFAWVTVRPATSSFARWAAKERGWTKAYHGGMQLWVSSFGQSMEKKEVYARTFARVLTAGGVEASAGSRMD